MSSSELDSIAPQVDLLAIGAHRDDVELLCGGTLAKAARQGYRTGILDLTGGEMGTSGNERLRGDEAQAAAEILGVTARRTAGLPDAGLENTPATICTLPASSARSDRKRSSCRIRRGAIRIIAWHHSSATTPASSPD